MIVMSKFKKTFKYENCKSCEYTCDKSSMCTDCNGNNHYSELYEADPNCVHKIISAGGGGVICKKCKGWFCF